MNCDNAEKNLFRYLEKAMPLKQTLSMGLHLAFCKRCKDQLAALQDSNTRISAAVQEPIDAADMTGDIMEIIRKMPAPTMRRSGMVWKVAFASVVIAAVAVTAMRFNQESKPSPVTVARIKHPRPVGHTNYHKQAEVSIAKTDTGDQHPKVERRANTSKIQTRRDQPIRHRHKPDQNLQHFDERTRIAKSELDDESAVAIQHIQEPTAAENYVIGMVGVDTGDHDKANYVINEIRTDKEAPVEL